uniref:Transporter n=1 Tax=Amphilophus citrinellus TaxID=61819 RepID=A0A3Q0QX79_AMPCI
MIFCTLNKETYNRGQWASKTEYLLVVAGNVVGLGNVWRFPYLCYKNGGGAFLLPYCLLAMVCGIPLFLLESSIGQYSQEGFITCWQKLCPLAQGIGYGYFIMKLYDFSYILIQVWALFYLVFSFRSQLPWVSCENTWNTAAYMVRCLCLCVCVSYFTASFPYAILLILLIRGLTLPGAWEGIYFYLYPDVNHLANLQVWIEAGSQIFFSYSLTMGTLNVLGSYNDYNNNCYKDCFWLCLLNSGTSFVAGFVVFSVLGFMAEKQGVTVDAVAESGPGLAFIAYPQATAMMPLPQFWTICFFLMLILLSVDTHFVTVESVITSVSDLFPTLFHAPVRHEIFVLAVCSAFFLIHLTLVTEGGIYIFQLIDYYGCTRACQDFMAVCECVAVAWIFGAERFSNVIADMAGQKPSAFFNLCWRYIIPLLTFSSFILYLVDYQHLTINDGYVYPDWAYKLGWAMTLSSVLLVPLWAAGQMYLTPGTFRQRLHVLCRPTEASVKQTENGAVKQSGDDCKAEDLCSECTAL